MRLGICCAVLSLFALGFAPASKALEGDAFYISGTVTNQANGAGIIGVQVQAYIGGDLIDVASTDADGNYTLSLSDPESTYRIEFSRRDFLPDEGIGGVIVGTTNANAILTPVAADGTPPAPVANSGPSRIYIEWAGAPEYNFLHYKLRRVETDAAGTPLGDPVDLPEDLTFNEYEDAGVTAGAYYSYTVRSVNGNGAEGPESPPSPPVLAKVVEVFFPHISAEQGVESTYLWQREAPGSAEQTLRIPVSVRAAYELYAAGIDIRGMLPNDLVIANTAADIEVRTTGITDGTLNLANAINGEFLIDSSASAERPLFGAGTLFDIYVKPRPGAGCPDTDNLVLFEDGLLPGVRLWDGGIPPTPYALRLVNGSLCFVDDDCVQGDVNDDGTINTEDVAFLLDLVTGAATPNACSNFAGDINLDGRIDSADATQLLRWIDGLSLNPDAAKSAEEAPSYALYPKQDTPQVRLGDAFSDPATGEVIFPVYIDSTTDLPLAGFALRIAYPASERGLVFESVTEGALLSEHVVRSRNEINGGYGSIHIAASASEALAAKGETELVSIRFRLGYDGFFDHWRPVTITSFASNDPYGHTPRHGAPGQPVLVASNGIVASSLFCEVLDDESGTPVRNATVSLNPAPTPAPGEREAGIYPFPALLAGTYTITATAEGFEAANRVVTIVERQLQTVTLRLQTQGSGGEPTKPIACSATDASGSAGTGADWLVLLAAALLLFTAKRPRGIQHQ